MPIAVAEEVKTDPVEPGAPIPKDQLDPELVKLGRARPTIGLVTAAGIVFLCAFFLLRLGPDRRFAGEPEAPTKVAVADIAAGKVDEDSHVVVDAEPLMAHAIRSATAKGNIGMRVVPARGTGHKLWLVLPGDGWAEPNLAGYAGRLRPLADLPFSDSIRAFLAQNPRPVFATAASVRGGFASNKVTTVGGDVVALRDGDRVAFDVVDPNAATVICAYNDRHPTAVECAKALTDAGVAITGTPEEGRGQARFTVTGPDAVATTRTKLESARLFGSQAEPVTTHYETMWGKLKGSAPAGFTVDTATVPDTQLDLIGLYVARDIPPGAYALLTGEKPQDYWYVMPVTILVGLIALLFAWAFVRAVKRDLLAPRAQTA